MPSQRLHDRSDAVAGEELARRGRPDGGRAANRREERIGHAAARKRRALRGWKRPHATHGCTESSCREDSRELKNPVLPRVVSAVSAEVQKDTEEVGADGLIAREGLGGRNSSLHCAAIQEGPLGSRARLGRPAEQKQPFRLE